MTKRIVICLDGTWNTPDSNPEVDGDVSTNVWKLHNLVLDNDSHGIQQTKYYETGVGTNWYDRVRGGVFGVGLSEKIKDAYKYLASKYEPGDEVYIFGFSRGAYTARSLVGLIRNSGVLKQSHIDLVDDAYALYRTRDEGPDSENAKYFRSEYCYEIAIKCLGVWDTVGALGVPIESFDWFNKKYYEFHDTELSGIVENAFHALAIDEHRKTYQCSLWDPKQKPNQRLEQSWFSGAHADIGGGYGDSQIADVSLRWMIHKAASCGLEFDDASIPAATGKFEPMHDSYKQFLGGAYSKFEPRYLRPVCETKYGNESIDPSAENRLKSSANYWPKNLAGKVSP
ncbi:MAG: DUF2235 domain-containing protein [Candidatus Contendobacter sp.]|nr:DUF2235 domain-containing protein [Candidatus Contendobacter sp.]